MKSLKMEEKIEKSINQALELKDTLKELQIQNYIESRILYEYCPLCKSKNITKSVIGNCSEHHLYNLKIPPTISRSSNGDDNNKKKKMMMIMKMMMQQNKDPRYGI